MNHISVVSEGKIAASLKCMVCMMPLKVECLGHCGNYLKSWEKALKFMLTIYPFPLLQEICDIYDMDPLKLISVVL